MDNKEIAVAILVLWIIGCVSAPVGPIPEDVRRELNNTQHYGFNITSDMLAASLPSECTLVQVDYCNNNEPNQFVCVNEAYASNLKGQYGRIYNTTYPQMSPGYVCPMFIAMGKLSCGLSGGYCTVIQSNSS